MDWFVLGIEPTKDKKIITNAYRQKLRQTNPEDKPQEFQALRAAYEEAMALADREEAETVRDESPLGLWMEAVEKTYGDYPSRIDPDCWKALMESDVCVGLDTRSGAEEALLRFLMQNYQKKIDRKDFLAIFDGLAKGFEEIGDNEISKKMVEIIPEVDEIFVNQDVNETQDVPSIAYYINGNVQLMKIMRRHNIVWSILNKYCTE